MTPVEVIKYKDIIRDQDAEIMQLKERLAGIQKEVGELQANKEQMSAQVQLLHDENTGERKSVTEVIFNKYSDIYNIC